MAYLVSYKRFHLSSKQTSLFLLQDQKDRTIVDTSEELPDDPKFSGYSEQDLEFGRSWEKSDLQALKSPVLHALWLVSVTYLIIVHNSLYITCQ